MKFHLKKFKELYFNYKLSAMPALLFTTVDMSISYIMLQITDLKKYNSQLFKELSVTKSYFESIKAELVQYKHSASSDYQPGMLSGR